MNIGVYITGHGFGHASRMTEIMNQLGSLIPSVHYYIRTNVPQWFFKQSLAKTINFYYTKAQIDIGVVQQNVFRPAKKRTLIAFEKFWNTRKGLLEQEINYFRDKAISLILVDISPVAFEIAEKLSVRSIGIANFSWDWIYRNYTEKYSKFKYLIDEIRASYQKASLLLRLPFSGDLSAFPVIKDIPLVARHWKTPHDKVYKKLEIPRNGPLVLITFGGFGMNNKIFENLLNIPGYNFVTTFPSSGEIPWVNYISEKQLINSDIIFPDLVHTSDIVVGKPGYGIVSECIANRKPFVYTSRGDFAEYQILVEGMKKFLPSVYIPQKDLFSGRWEKYLEKAVSLMWPKETIPVNGAEVAAKEICNFL